MPSDWWGCDTYAGSGGAGSQAWQGTGGGSTPLLLWALSGHYAVPCPSLQSVQDPARSRQLAVAGIADMQQFIRCMRLMPNEVSAETDSSPVLASTVVEVDT